MFSLLFIALALVGLMMILSRRGHHESYPGSITYGSLMVEFSKVDRICYAVAALSVVAGVTSGVILIWGPDVEQISKILATSGVLFVGSLFMIVLNRLMHGRESM